MNVLSALTQARAKIEDPKRWAKCAEARDSIGESVHPSDPKAVRWCAVGSLDNVCREAKDYHIYHNAATLLDIAARQVGTNIATCQRYIDIVVLNDQGQHKDVIAAFDLAIQKAAQEEGLVPMEIIEVKEEVLV